MERVWIKGDRKRGPEVIKKLESLGGKSILSDITGYDEQSIYFISHSGIITSERLNSSVGMALAWAGKELTLPTEKVEAGFKVGDRIILQYPNEKPIIGTITSILENECRIWYKDDNGIAGRFPFSDKYVTLYNSKFRVGDFVRFNQDKQRIPLDFGIIQEILPNHKYKVIIDNAGKKRFDIVDEEDMVFIRHSNNLKKLDPVMVSDNGEEWECCFYSHENFAYSSLHKNKEIISPVVWKYIVPFTDFDFNDLESNVNKNVV